MVPLEKNDDGPPYERCCICRERTAFWTKLSNRSPGQQVACCICCAAHATINDIPTKHVWCRRERIIELSQAARKAK